MADDQVKYSDLIVDDGAIDALDKRLDDIKRKMAEVKGEAATLTAETRNLSTATREQQQATTANAAAAENLRQKMKGLTDEQKQLEAERRKYAKLTEQEANRVKVMAGVYQQYAAAVREGTDAQMKALPSVDIQNKSYNELYQTYNALKDALNKMTVAERENTAAGKSMVNQAKEIRDTLNNLQQATGNYALNVGNYMSAFNGLQFQTQQLLREIPSAVNIKQFFLAISNNIPMFTDALVRYNKGIPEIKVKMAGVQVEIAKLNAELATMNTQTAEYEAKLVQINALKKQEIELQKASIGGWKAVMKAVGSWQTLIIVGLVLLQKIPDILKNIANWVNRVTGEAKMLRDVNNGAASSIGEMTAKYKALQQEWKNLKSEDIDTWLKQHKDDWSELGESIDSAKKAEDFYVNNTAAVQKAIDDRARSISAMKLAAEKYEQAFKKQAEAEEGLKNRRTSFWSGVARGLAGAGMAEGTGYLTPEQQAFQDRSEQQAAEELHQKRMKEVNDLMKEAEGYLKFVLPSNADAAGCENDKNPKDKVADLLTLRRQLEDAVIANIENEFEREEAAEIARHQRFIEDKQKELELVKGDAERTAVINQQIEEEHNTHDRNMLDIDEKYRQKIIKRIEEQKKAEEQAAKEAERLAKEKIAQEEKDFKAHQEIDKRRFELTKHTAKEERKFVMQQQMEFLQWRIKNAKALGISPELLEVMKQEYAQMQEMFNKGIYSTGKKNTYSSGMEVIADVLGFDIDSNQISALNSVFDQAKAALNSWMDARKAAADQAKELADDEVSAAENALNREIELRNQGYANDVALREKELADAKAQQKKAVEEQKKIAQEQILIDAAMQASSMITASANIIKQFPNPLAWVPMLAVMWGAYGYAKLKAYQEAGNVKLYREGGVMLLNGGSHESGHDVNLGIGPDGSNLRAEGGEYFAVINKRNSRKYGNEIPAVVNALNSGMFEDRYIKTSDAVGLLPRIIRADDGSAVDLSAVESGVGQLVKQGETSYNVVGDYMEIRYKNRVRRVRIG